PLNPFWVPIYVDQPGQVFLHSRPWPWGGVEQAFYAWSAVGLVARFFWVNWILFLINFFVFAFPLDAWRIPQCLLLSRYGFRQATVYAIVTGFIVMLVVAIFALAASELLAAGLALLIYATCRQQLIYLESGAEGSLFRYDFTQGYTSLERVQPPPRRKRPNF